MPRKSPLSHVDLEIARRLSELRKLYRLSREDWADRADQSQDLIARIELGRVPLLYRHAVNLLPHLGVASRRNLPPFNPLWITYGTEPVRLDWPFLLPKPDDIGVSGGIRFVDFVDANRSLLEGFSWYPPRGHLPEPWLAPYMTHFSRLSHQLELITEGVGIVGSLFRRSAERLAPASATASQWLEAFHSRMADDELQAGTVEKSAVDRITLKRNTPSVPSEIQKLIDRLKLVASVPGRKKFLAVELEVSPARISEWLSGKKEPGGNYTLRLLQWVEEWEREQQKRPGSAINTTRAKAQSERKYEQPNTSGPQKR